MSLGITLACLLITGCATPNLRPFADATATLKTSVKIAGDLTISQLSAQTITISDQTFIPGETNHPAARLETSWQLRRNAMDAVASYSSSLASIADAAASGKGNAQRVVDAVNQLASHVPAIGLGLTAAGDLLVSLGATLIEVKAYRDLAKAVNAAHPVIQLVAESLMKDFDALAIQYESLQRNQIRKLKDSAEKPRAYHAKLIEKRSTLRAQSDGIADDSARRDTMHAIDTLVAAVEPEVLAYDREISRRAAELRDGLQFFREAREALAVWLSAHRDVHIALREKRAPNIILLVSRAQELAVLASNFRQNAPHQPNGL
jgi:hypothetical protein